MTMIITVASNENCITRIAWSQREKQKGRDPRTGTQASNKPSRDLRVEPVSLFHAYYSAVPIVPDSDVRPEARMDLGATPNSAIEPRA